MPNPSAVRSMFARIARRYDLANHLLSGGVDFWWRQKLVRAVRDCHPRRVLDLATGSGDVAFAIANALPGGAAITGMDFCAPMLDEAGRKQAERPARLRITFTQGDGMELPLPSRSFDAVTIAFGLRNMADRHKCLTEMRRVLRSGGTLVVLEFSQPQWWFRPAYYVYLQLVLPWIAGLVAGDRGAYEYLGGSIASFPNRDAMTAEIERAGLRVRRAESLTFGIVALHVAEAWGDGAPVS